LATTYFTKAIQLTIDTFTYSAFSGPRVVPNPTFIPNRGPPVIVENEDMVELGDGSKIFHKKPAFGYSALQHDHGK